VRERVARSRQLVARSRKAAVVARVMQISRQAIYRTPKPRTRPGPRPATGTVDRAIVEVAKANPTDGTRDIAAYGLDLRCRRQETETVIEAGAVAHAIESGQLTLGTDNGTAYTSRGFRARLKELGIAHRRGGYRDPESQALIESWFSKLKERLIWRSEFETLEDARVAIATYVDAYHHRPHSGLGYRTPKEVRKTWEDAQEQDVTTNSSGLG
jgi:transposase InsO family protein